MLEKRKMLLRMGRFALVAVVATTCMICGCHQSISGSYLTSDRGAVCWLQIVQTSDNHLTGQLATSVLKPDGNIDQTATVVTGAVDGMNITISGQGLFGLSEFALSGMQNGDTLTLTGAQPVPIVFKRATVTQFQLAKSVLNTESQSIIKAKAEAEAQQKMLDAEKNFIATVDGLIVEMDRFKSEADVHLGRFPNAEKGYESITTKMQAYLVKERQLAGNDKALNQRVQISNAMVQGTNLTEQMHNQAVSLESSFEGNIKPRAEQSLVLLNQCHSTAPSNTLTADEIRDFNNACSRLQNSYRPFREKYDATVSGLSHLEQVYQKERTTQERLVQEANALN